MRALTLTATLLLLVAAGRPSGTSFPWQQAGLTERQAAAHLLNRFAYGPRPGEVDRIVETGLERWFERQLDAELPDRRLEERLRELPALEMPSAQIIETYSRFAGDQEHRPQRELMGQLMAQKLWRAVESENQLAEVMTDFWFNHFNVSLQDNQSRPYLLSYERDAVRPHALGRVRDLLGATARHPAMLLYLDNARSSAAPGAPTTFERARARQQERRPRGLNENYARELLELHTLGVDGGYTQKDVVEVARAFTGWSMLPPGSFRKDVERRARRAGRMGFQVEGEFLFRADLHDAGEKTVFGRRLPAGRGIEDGEAVLDLLAVHPSTARHLATKLAVRFVSDQPPKALVDRLTAVYLESGGDVRRLLRTIAESPDFWAPAAVGAKIKSPLELTASALRVVDGRVEDPRATLRWIAEMGQPLYAYQAPTGYPDRAEAWVNTGSLLNRLNFGLQLAAGRVQGVDLDLSKLNGGREPDSREAALRTYAGLLMPGRDVEPSIKTLTPMANDPGLAEKAKPLEQVVGAILGSPEFQRR
ncbi:MAG TPA: DUF1800 domain-containing protein [Thermoanaerobaculia bacterium]|nr:DUF1800 domain-containing protein [Thermoanaerobaculia bacterium]